jgi:ABC-type dipeptide/oligopeptide/nickel transport system ATPase component
MEKILELKNLKTRYSADNGAGKAVDVVRVSVVRGLLESKG